MVIFDRLKTSVLRKWVRQSGHSQLIWSKSTFDGNILGVTVLFEAPNYLDYA